MCTMILLPVEALNMPPFLIVLIQLYHQCMRATLTILERSTVLDSGVEAGSCFSACLYFYILSLVSKVELVS